MAAPSSSRRRKPSRRGWSLIEMVVFVTIVSLLTAFTLPPLLDQIQRARLTGVSREAAAFLRLARLSAIRQSRQAQVRLNAADRTLIAFLDDDQDGVQDADEPEIVPLYNLPVSTLLREPGGQTGIDSVDGFQIQGNEAIVIFNTDGSAQATGAIRISDGRQGAAANYLEVRLAPRTTAQIEIRKWDGSAWHAQGEGGTNWQWN